MTLWLHISTLHLQASTDFTINFEHIISSTSSPIGFNFCCSRLQDASLASEHHPHPSNSAKYLPVHAASSYSAAVSFFDSGIQFYRTLFTLSSCLGVWGCFEWTILHHAPHTYRNTQAPRVFWGKDSSLRYPITHLGRRRSIFPGDAI
jgi:hypothetical protein